MIMKKKATLRLSEMVMVMVMAFLIAHPLASGQRAAGLAGSCALIAPGTITSISTFLRGTGRCFLSTSCHSMSWNNITLTSGLTTCPGGVQHGEGGLLLPTLGATKVDFAKPPAGSPHFGDIMGGTEDRRADLLSHFDPLERVALTANGNLQRIVSSYYASPVTVDIKHSEEIEPSVYDREVTLSVLGQEFCVAKSLVILHSATCVEAVKQGNVGIGQLFRSLDVLPSFELLNAGRSAVGFSLTKGEKDDDEQGGASLPKGSGGLWRIYDLRSRHLSCRIHEVFSPDLFDLAA